MSNIKVSIITVSYNAAKTIEQTIQSVVNQTYNNIEYIIIDGGSTDGTVDIIEKYEDKIAYWVSEPDNGIYDAMNKGIKKAVGKYIQFLGSDDCLIKSDVIGQISSIFLENVDIASFPVIAVDEDLKIEHIMSNKIDTASIPYGNMLPHQGVFVDAKLMKNYLFNTKYSLIADFDFIAKCAINNKKFMYMDTPIAYYSLGGATNNTQKVFDEFVSIFRSNMIDEQIISDFIIKYNPDNRLNQMRHYIKKLLKSFFPTLLKKILLTKSWKIHSCNWPFCRWCKK